MSLTFTEIWRTLALWDQFLHNQVVQDMVTLPYMQATRGVWFLYNWASVKAVNNGITAHWQCSLCSNTNMIYSGTPGNIVRELSRSRQTILFKTFRSEDLHQLKYQAEHTSFNWTLSGNPTLTKLPPIFKTLLRHHKHSLPHLHHNPFHLLYCSLSQYFSHALSIYPHTLRHSKVFMYMPVLLYSLC